MANASRHAKHTARNATFCRGLWRVLTIGLLLAHRVHAQSLDVYEQARQRMVDQEIVAAGVTEPRVVAAMRKTPRHEFVPRQQRKYAYYDMALPIGYEQTISPPFIVAYMTAQLEPKATDRVLEIGTGSGYQAAVLSPLVKEVYTIEIVEPLGRRAALALKQMNYDNVHVKIGDGFQGWPEHAPFDKIIVTCSPDRVPSPLVEQLKPNGLMIVPVGERYQQVLYLFSKQGDTLAAEALLPTLFVPMTGAAEERRLDQPDPLNPSLRNGSFETQLEDSGLPQAWHYARQISVVQDEREARQGSHYVVFKNEDPGRGSQALQGFAIDGRKIAQLDVALWVRGDMLRSGQTNDEWPRMEIHYYDQSRNPLGLVSLGPWKGTFPWRQETARLAVPLKAREAILRIGLLGGTGTIRFDDVRISAAQNQKRKVMANDE